MYILQTYFTWRDLEECGFSREFRLMEEAESFARANFCGNRYTITFISSNGYEVPEMRANG